MASSEIIFVTSLFLLILQFDQSCAAVQDTYTAAVLGLRAEESYISPEYALDISIAHYENLINYLMHNKSHAPDIIVFPEGGLHGMNDPFPIEVPSAEKNPIPCNELKYNKALRNLSCIAKSKRIYLVVNLVESYFNTSKNATVKFNTNIVFDRNGAVVARYRKSNSRESGYDSPGKQEISFFKTDFDVTFGVVTGNDIIFKEPLDTLIKNLEIKHYVHPSKWFNELPFFTGIQMQSALTYSERIVLLSAGYNDPELGYSGTGIYGPFYHGHFGPIAYSQPESDKAFALIANVPKGGIQERALHKSVESLDVIMNEENLSFEANLAKMEAKTLNRPLSKNSKLTVPRGLHKSFLNLTQDTLKPNDSVLIKPVLETKIETDLSKETTQKIVKGTALVNKTLCIGKTKNKNQFCCKFDVEMSVTYSSNLSVSDRIVSGDNFTNYHYRLAVYDGIKTFPNQENSVPVNIKICGIIPCLNENVDSCGLRTDEHNIDPPTIITPATVEVNGETFTKVKTKFKSIKIETEIKDNSSDIYPIILLKSQTNDEFGSLPDESTFTFTKRDFVLFNEVTLVTKKKVDNLGSIGILARTHKNNSPSLKSNLCYLLLIIPIIMIHSSLSIF